MKKSLFTIIALGLSVLSACGGGGGGGGGDNPTPTQPATAIIKLATSGTLASGTDIGAINLTGVLPAGVTVKATPDSANPAKLVANAGVVTASGVATGANVLVTAIYTAAVGGVPGKVDITVIDAGGFGTGEFVTVRCDIASGTTVTAGNFSQPINFTADDVNGVAINGLTLGYTVDIK
jgi:hypothetical protein